MKLKNKSKIKLHMMSRYVINKDISFAEAVPLRYVKKKKKSSFTKILKFS